MRSISLLLIFGSAIVSAQTFPQDYLIKSIYFGGGSYYVDSLQRIELKEFLDDIPDLENYNIGIHSHTDNIGGPEYNAWLSQMRSRSVEWVIRRLRTDLSQVEIKDFGEFNPTFDNQTMEGRLKNRRVDVILWPLVF